MIVQKVQLDRNISAEQAEKMLQVLLKPHKHLHRSARRTKDDKQHQPHEITSGKKQKDEKDSKKDSKPSFGMYG